MQLLRLFTFPRSVRLLLVVPLPAPQSMNHTKALCRALSVILRVAGGNDVLKDEFDSDIPETTPISMIPSTHSSKWQLLYAISID